MPTDRPGLEMRRWLSALLAAHGEPEAPGRWPADGGVMDRRSGGGRMRDTTATATLANRIGLAQH